jgi:hypothetical protein
MLLSAEAKIILSLMIYSSFLEIYIVESITKEANQQQVVRNLLRKA